MNVVIIETVTRRAWGGRTTRGALLLLYASGALEQVSQPCIDVFFEGFEVGQLYLDGERWTWTSTVAGAVQSFDSGDLFSAGDRLEDMYVGRAIRAWVEARRG